MQGVQRLARKIKLACCGDCVSDDLVVNLARGRPLEAIESEGLRALGQRGCKPLLRIVCDSQGCRPRAGCAGLTDEAVNEFSTVRWKPPAEHLLLAHCAAWAILVWPGWWRFW